MRGTILMQVLKQLNSDIQIKNDLQDAKGYFKNRRGLWVSDEFTKKILYDFSITSSDLVIESWEIIEDSSDKIIETALENENIFGMGDACVVVAALIEKQKNGEEGMLLNTGDMNILYTSSCVVSVSWNSFDREWSVDTWQRDANEWYAGRRVFSPATDNS